MAEAVEARGAVVAEAEVDMAEAEFLMRDGEEVAFMVVVLLPAMEEAVVVMAVLRRAPGMCSPYRVVLGLQLTCFRYRGGYRGRGRGFAPY